MKRTYLASQASYLLSKWISMLALIEAEKTTKSKSTQTSIKKTAPNLCTYTWKGRSLQLYKVDLPNCFVAQLVRNRLFRCSTAKCYSKKFEECKRSCFHVPFEDKLLSAGQMFEQRTMQLTTEKAYQAQWVSMIKLSVVDWTSNFLKKGNSNYFSNPAKMPATIDRPDSLTSKLSESIRFETMGKSPGDENNFPQ